MTQRFAAVILLVLLTVCPSVDGQSRDVFRNSDVSLRLGHGTMLARPTEFRQQAVTFDPSETAPPSNIPVSSELRYQLIESEKDFFNFTFSDFEMHIDAVFADGDYTRTRSQAKWTEGSTVILGIRAEEDYGWTSLPPSTRPRDDAAQLLQEGKHDLFTRRYGDAIVVAERRGAFLTVMLTVRARDQRSVTTLREKYGAQGGALGFSADISGAEVELIDSAVSAGSVNYEVFARGGKGMAGLAGTLKSVDDYKALRSSIVEYLEQVKGTEAPVIAYRLSPIDVYFDAPGMEIGRDMLLKEQYYQEFKTIGEAIDVVKDLLAADRDRPMLSDEQRSALSAQQLECERKQIALVDRYKNGHLEPLTELLPPLSVPTESRIEPLFTFGLRIGDPSRIQLEMMSQFYPDASGLIGYVDGFPAAQVLSHRLHLDNGKVVNRRVVRADFVCGTQEQLREWLDNQVPSFFSDRGFKVTEAHMRRIQDQFRSEGFERAMSAGQRTGSVRTYFVFFPSMQGDMWLGSYEGIQAIGRSGQVIARVDGRLSSLTSPQ